MDLDSIERCWRGEAAVPPPPLEEVKVIAMIESRVSELRRAVRARLRREASYYLPMTTIGVVSLISSDVTPSRLIAAASVALLLGGMMATLRLAERRIVDAPFDRSLREALSRLVSQLDAAARAYLIAYVLVFVFAGVALSGVVWWREGFGAFFAGVVAAGAVGVLWSVSSGRAYVERMFRRDRAALADCLRQLDE